MATVASASASALPTSSYAGAVSGKIDTEMTPPPLEMVWEKEVCTTSEFTSVMKAPIFLANALRRVIVADVDAPGVPDRYIDRGRRDQSCDDDMVGGGVHIINNTGRLHNEFIRHRLSLLPMPSFLDRDYLARNEVKIHIKALAAKTVRSVYFGDADGDNATGDSGSQNTQFWSRPRPGYNPGDSSMEDIDQMTKSKDGWTNITDRVCGGSGRKSKSTMYSDCLLDTRPIGVTAYSTRILITRLQPREALEVVMYPTVSVPSKSCSTRGFAGFATSTIATYMFQQDEEKVKAARHKLKEDSERAIFANYGRYTAEYAKVDENNMHYFLFTVESVGIVPPREIVKQALEKLLRKVNRVHMMFKESTYAEYHTVDCPYVPPLFTVGQTRVHRLCTGEEHEGREEWERQVWECPSSNSVWLQLDFVRKEEIAKMKAVTLKVESAPEPAVGSDRNSRDASAQQDTPQPMQLRFVQSDIPVVSEIQASRVPFHNENGNVDHVRYTFCIPNEDHTIGNLLQGFMYPLCENSASDVVFVGYRKPHPLKDYIEFAIGVKEEGQDVSAATARARRIVQRSLEALSQNLIDLERSFPREKKRRKKVKKGKKRRSQRGGSGDAASRDSDDSCDDDDDGDDGDASEADDDGDASEADDDGDASEADDDGDASEEGDTEREICIDIGTDAFKATPAPVSVVASVERA